MSEKLNAKIHVLLGGEEQITSPFGKRKDPVTGKASTHNGVDLIGAGITILCAADGVVQATRNTYTGSTRDGSAGNFIIVQHDGYDTVYYHLKKDSLRVKKGDTVKAGQRIAVMGCTGHATGVHLHFGIDIEDKKHGKTGWTDPVPYLRGEKTLPGMATYKLKTVQGNRGDKPVLRWGKSASAECRDLMLWLNRQHNARILADGIPGARTYAFAKKHKVKRDADGYASEWVQRRLKTMGYYSGVVDGEPRGLTDKAIRAFQEDYGLTADGVIADADWYYLLAWEG